MSSRLVRLDFEGVALAKMLRRKRTKSSRCDEKKQKGSDVITKDYPEVEFNCQNVVVDSSIRVSKPKNPAIRMGPLVKRYLAEESEWIQRRQLLHRLPDLKSIASELKESLLITSIQCSVHR